MSYPTRMASIDAVKLVLTDGPVRIRFPGSNKSALLDSFTASAILAVYNALNDDNKATVERMVRSSPASFHRVAGFAFEHTRCA